MAAINTEVHNVVVIFEGVEYGFTGLAAAVAFIEQQYAGVKDKTKVFNQIATAISDDKADNLQIFDVDSYSDLFMDEDENEDEDEDENV
ncbi:hypothetical protein [Streptomyces anandii]|uniref:hypothetical protein n=1 Tax=Streptomyces anandii TaxID=285454 RepID=UPI003676CD66